MQLHKFQNLVGQWWNGYTLLIIAWFEKEDNLTVTLGSLVIAYLCCKSIIDGKRIKTQTEASISKGLALLESKGELQESQVDKVKVLEIAFGYYNGLFEEATKQLDNAKINYEFGQTRDSARDVESAQTEVDKNQSKVEYYSQILEYLKSN